MESYHEPLLIVSHQAVLRLVYSYLMRIPRAKATHLEVRARLRAEDRARTTALKRT